MSDLTLYWRVALIQDDQLYMAVCFWHHTLDKSVFTRYQKYTAMFIWSDCTALRNHNRIVFEEMSSWTALTMHLGMKTTFKTKYIFKANMLGILL